MINIGEWRKQLRISQRVLAKRAGISASALSNIEHGRHKPAARTLKRIIWALEYIQNIRDNNGGIQWPSQYQHK